MALADYVGAHAAAHDSPISVDVHFFKVLCDESCCRDDLVALIEPCLLPGAGEFGDLNADAMAGGPSYITLGGWIGDQGLALLLIGLGDHLKVWKAITPATLGITGADADKLAGGGMVMTSGYHPEGLT